MSATIETISGRVRRAELFYENIEDLYIGLGRTSEWEDEDNPPIPTGEETDIQEAIGFKEVEEMFYVVEDEVEGTITFRGKRWRTLGEEDDIFEEQCHWIYVATSFVGDELPLTSYRQIGLYSGLKPYPEYDENKVLLPSEVDDRGALEVIGNRGKVDRQEDQTDKPVIILEF